jgi:preprotein translocase subunit YajC
MREQREIHEGDFIAWEQGEGVFTISGIGKVITLRDTEMGVIDLIDGVELRLQRDVKTRAIILLGRTREYLQDQMEPL